MKHASWKFLAMAAATVGFVACKDALTPLPVSDVQLESNVAASSGDALASEVNYLTLNEGAAALPSAQPDFNLFGSAQDSESVSFTRTRTCLDSAGGVVAGCTPLSSVRKIITAFSVNGTRTGVFFYGAIHRAANDTLTRVRNAALTADSLRIHSGVGSAHDTTTFNDTTSMGIHTENATDSINAVTFRIPRITNPFPISGSIVRNVAVHASYTKNNTTTTRDVVRRVEVDFPADAQGNVVLTINAKVCNLNLVTHAVTNCH
ncbi:MAG: hypothetical protein ACHQU1_04645 [Gemmatimonadales bacterium]